MKYEVIKGFVDLQDNNHAYRTGDEFPRAGVDVSEDRIAELASESNRCGVALIKAAEENEPVEVEKPTKKPKKKEK